MPNQAASVSPLPNALVVATLAAPLWRDPDVPTVVVVQSDELSAWIGIAGVAVGVLLTAGIDSLRKRAAERNNRHDILLDYGSNIVTGGISLAEARDAAGVNAHQSPWAEMIATRKDALTVEYSE